MKTIKKLTIIIAIIAFSFAKAQNINNLSLNEFYNEICFENTCLNNIIDTHSDLGNIKTLFNTPVVKSRDDNTTNSIGYKVKGYFFDFEETSTSNSDKDYSIAYVWVENNSKVDIKGISIGIGDNISKLGSVKILKSGKIVFYNEDTNASLNILYSNNKITEISFIFD